MEIKIMHDEIIKAYDLVHESKASKTSMTAGKVKPGDLDGPTKQTIKKSGPEEAEGTEKAEEAPAGLNPVKKKKTKEVKESTNMTFQDLYDQVIKEQDIESDEYSDDVGDFPPAGDEAAEGDLEDVGGEEAAEGDKFAQLADLFSQAADLLRGMSAGAGDVADMGDEEAAIEEPPVGEAVSEPAPKDFKGNTKQFQAPTKLGVNGTKVVKKKAFTGDTKARTGEIGAAPKGATPGKSPMKVGGTGAAASGKNASMLE